MKICLIHYKQNVLIYFKQEQFPSPFDTLNLFGQSYSHSEEEEA